MDGLILFSHGSVLCGAGEALEAHAHRFRERGEWTAVEIGYLNYSRPTFQEAVQRLASNGIRRIVIVPYFLVPGKFVTHDLPRAIAQAKLDCPEVDFFIAEPIGFDAALADVILELAESAYASESWGADLKRAADRCERNPRCPLFGTERCRDRIARKPEAVA